MASKSVIMKQIIGCVYEFYRRTPKTGFAEKGCAGRIMDIQNFFSQITMVKWYDIVDVLVVAFLIYRLIPLIRTSGTIRIFAMIGALLVITWVTELANLHTLNFVMQQIVDIGVIAVLILYQPELRRFVDGVVRDWSKKYKPVQEMDMVIDQVVMAAETMSRERTGALMVFAREASLDEYIKTGTLIDGRVSEQLIRNIFFNKAALHDGAMVIRNGRVISAGCVLPLSDDLKISADLGTRHRAGKGISEVSDAVVVIVSEETGVISFAVGGVLKRYLAPQTLERLLRKELITNVEIKETFLSKLGQEVKGLWQKAQPFMDKFRKKKGDSEDEK